MNICYYLAACGDPGYSNKIEVLANNLNILKNANYNIDLIINIYDDSIIDLEFFGKFVSNIYVSRKEGVLAELWLTNEYNNLIKKYDYIILILDDVMLDKTFNLNTILDKKNIYNLNIISPYIYNAGGLYNKSIKLQKNIDIIETNCLEFFCYIMNSEDFFLYLDTVCVDNRWTWGNDLLLKHFGLSSGIDVSNKAFHMLSNNNNNRECFDSMDRFLLNNGFTDTQSVLDKYPYVKNKIYVKKEIDILCINLLRREDRKLDIYDKFNKEGLNVIFWEAVDGKTLALTDEILYMFRNNNFNYRQGVIGCALSHYNIWKKIVEENNPNKH